MEPKPLRILVLSGLGKDSGCMVRARYLTASLKNAGADATLAPGIRTLPLFLDLMVSAVWNLRLLFSACDVIIACKPLPSVTPLLMLKGMRGAITVVDIDDLDYGYRTGLLSWITRRMETPFPKRCNIVTYHNEALIRVIRDTFRVGPEHLFPLPQGVDLSIFYPRQQLAHRNGTVPGLVVVYPAHLNRASDLDAIFEVLRLARQLLPALRLIVIGGGPKERHFRRLAKAGNLDGYVEFTGYVQPERVPAYLAMGDAGIVYYKDTEVNYYRSSMKLREMLAAGLKVVSTDVGECRQFARFTYQAPPEPQAVAELLVRTLTEGGDGREVAGSAFVRKEMNWNTIGDRLYKKLAAVAAAEQSH